GDGLTSLQYREEKGGTTHELQSNLSGPQRLRIEKRGKYVYLWAGGRGEELRPASGSTRLTFSGAFYVGMGVCSHDKDVVERAVFSHVALATEIPASKTPMLYSALETIDISTADRRLAYLATERIQ